MWRALRVPASAAVAGSLVHHAQSEASAPEGGDRFQQLPPDLASQQFRPTTPYPGWDHNWDYCELSTAEVATRLSHESPVVDFEAAIHRLYAEHTDRSKEKVDELISKTLKSGSDDLPSLYKRAFTAHANGGAVTRHIILVRHGQYEEQRSLARRLRAEDRDTFGLPVRRI